MPSQPCRIKSILSVILKLITYGVGITTFDNPSKAGDFA